MKDYDLRIFDPQEKAKAKAEQILKEWQNNPYRKPSLQTHRNSTIVNRIVEALEAGFTDPVIALALDKCWKFSSRPAWGVALNIAYGEIDEDNKPTLNETQKSVLRLRSWDDNYELPEGR
tara:strand:+ start:9440 stop:9799 length:360 start_codon:yes stop_codon:yes gene_type:complete